MLMYPPHRSCEPVQYGCYQKRETAIKRQEPFSACYKTLPQGELNTPCEIHRRLLDTNCVTLAVVCGLPVSRPLVLGGLYASMELSPSGSKIPTQPQSSDLVVVLEFDSAGSSTIQLRVSGPLLRVCTSEVSAWSSCRIYCTIRPERLPDIIRLSKTLPRELIRCIR